MKKYKVHLICNAHLDPVWQWRWEEGCAEALATFSNAVQILKEHNELIFNHNEAVLYQWVKKYNPKLFIEIQKLVEAGRWCISGGWYLQPDVNMPGIESIIRNIIEGRRFFNDHFNVVPKVAYNFDSFGHSGGLPQVLKLAGYKMYIHMRPQHPDLILPSNIYQWQGVDGSEILGYRIEVGLYHTEYENIEQRLKEGVDLSLKLNRDVPLFWGIGNHGGGATREDLRKIDEFIKRENRVEIIHSTTEKFYEAIKEFVAEAPVVKGDLQKIFTGCYTSLSRLKRGEQKSLAQLLQAEKLSSASWWLNNAKYPADVLQEMWNDHLFNDFHDILPGSCIEPAEKDALDLYGKVSEQSRRLMLAAANSFNQGEYQSLYLPVTVLNSNFSLTKLPVEVECMISYRPKWEGVWHLKLFDLAGKEIDCQEEQPEALLPFNGWRRKISFMAELPNVGVSNYKIEVLPGEKKKAEAKPKINYQFDETTGLINQLFIDEVNCLSGNLFEPMVIEDNADSWGTNQWSYRNVIGKFKLINGSHREIENGSIRKITQSILEYNHSKIVFHTIAYSDWNVLEFRLRIYWNEERKRLKLSIPTIFKNEKLLCEVPGGAIERPADGEEHVNGRWIMVNPPDGKTGGNRETENDIEDFGFAIVHNGQHGFDNKDGEIRLSVLRSSAYCHEQGFKIEQFPSRKFSDIGVHEVRLLLTVGEKNKVLKSLSSLVDWLNAPPIAYAHLPIGKSLSNNKLLSISQSHIQLHAIKKSFEGEALILRLQNSVGNQSDADIEFFKPKLKFHLNFEPFEIKTIRLEKDGRWKEVNLITEE
ncbi:MAG: hypothetical protein NTX22_10465 [Ignavibacteriales bacterium]|nr:hypothetical protein [Ignavibacteriales bacterium]